MTAKDYAYDTTATTTIVYAANADIFANSKSSACPILSCTLTQTDCSSALVAPFNSLLSIDAADPWNLRISQTQGSGYPDVAVCYSCTNYKHTMTNQITIRQHINCAIALNSNTTSLLKSYFDPVSGSVNYAAIPYAASPSTKALTEYAAGTSIFSQTA